MKYEDDKENPSQVICQCGGETFYMFDDGSIICPECTSMVSNATIFLDPGIEYKDENKQ